MPYNDDYFLDRSRVIGFADVDAFAVQVFFDDKRIINEEPCVLALKTKRIISANHIAKSEYGIHRDIKLDEALDKCPHLNVDYQPLKYGKPDNLPLTKDSDRINDAIVDTLEQISCDIIVQQSSMDEFYFDLTDYANDYVMDNIHNCDKDLVSMNIIIEAAKSHILGNDYYKLRDSLIHGAVLMHYLSREIKRKTGFDLSFGVSYNKLLAKIACGLNKPNGITVIDSKAGIAAIFRCLPILNVEKFGGDMGKHIAAKLNINTLMDLRTFTEQELNDAQNDDQREYRHMWPIDGHEMWRMARGICDERVVPKRLPKYINSKREIYNGTRTFGELFTEFKQEMNYLYDRLNYELWRNRRIPNKLKARFYLRSGFVTKTRDDFMDFYDDSLEILHQIWDPLRCKMLDKIQDMVDKRVYRIELTVYDFSEVEERFADRIYFAELFNEDD